jgi:hypothetical protein
MPNYDAGHYFLTVLAPVRIDTDDAQGRYSCRQTLLDTLARLPNSQTGPTTRNALDESPFSRNAMTHLARFVLIDAPPYNGRVQGDTLVGLVTGADPLAPQPADALATPYLLFAADFDAPNGTDASLRAFTDTLWATMAEELKQIFGQCYGFAGVGTADSFFEYIKRCQVETTLPFNDYWRPAAVATLVPPPSALATALAPVLAIAKRAVPILVLAWLAFFLAAALLHDSIAREAARTVARYGVLAIPVILIVIGLVVLWLSVKGRKPFPPGAKLPDVLKSLYLQQRFLDFVVDNQGVEPAALHAAFGVFAATHAPANEAAPTQPRGIIRMPATTEGVVA